MGLPKPWPHVSIALAHVREALNLSELRIRRACCILLLQGLSLPTFYHLTDFYECVDNLASRNLDIRVGLSEVEE